MHPSLPLFKAEEISSRDARVLFLGTGNTTAETALALVSRGHRGKMVALSESGMFPSDLNPELASKLHEIVAWHRLELKAGHVLDSKILKKRNLVRAIRVSYFSTQLDSPAKLECDVILDFTRSDP